MMTRRELMMLLAAAGAGSSFSHAPLLFAADKTTGWIKYANNPVLGGGSIGTCGDVWVLREAGKYRMWFEWYNRNSIALTESTDGIHWSEPEIVLAPLPETHWEDRVNRPTVVHVGGRYHLWYTGQAKGRSKIGYAISKDGRHWVRQSAHPVLESTVAWEGVATMCPDVMWDPSNRTWRMWYSAGGNFEPNAIGYATSKDGLHWEKYPANPVMAPDPRYEWEKDRVTAAQIIPWKGWYYSLYIGFSDIHHAQIGMARSRDGITNWVRNAANPIIRPTPGGFDKDACYKPFAVYSHGRWMLWHNGRHDDLERIGLVIHPGADLDFVPAT